MPAYLDTPSSLLLCRNVGLSAQFLVHFFLIHTQTPYALELALQTLETCLSQSGRLLNILITGQTCCVKGNILCPGDISSTAKGDLIRVVNLVLNRENLILPHDRPEEPGSVGVRERPAVSALLSLVFAAIFKSFVGRERLVCP